jgi:hypothetical protein
MRVRPRSLPAARLPGSRRVSGGALAWGLGLRRRHVPRLIAGCALLLGVAGSLWWHGSTSSRCSTGASPGLDCAAETRVIAARTNESLHQPNASITADQIRAFTTGSHRRREVRHGLGIAQYLQEPPASLPESTVPSTPFEPAGPEAKSDSEAHHIPTQPSPSKRSP